MKFKDEFRIRNIKELVTIEYGPEFNQQIDIGRVWVIDHAKKKQRAFTGQMIRDDDGKYSLDGFGVYID